MAGAVKVMVTARYFGAGDQLDAFVIAFLLPAFFTDIVAGSFGASFVPAFIRVRSDQGDAAARIFARTGLALVLGAMLAVSVLLGGLPDPGSLPLLGSSFSPEKAAHHHQLVPGFDPVASAKRVHRRVAGSLEREQRIRASCRSAADYASGDYSFSVRRLQPLERVHAVLGNLGGSGNRNPDPWTGRASPRCPDSSGLARLEPRDVRDSPSVYSVAGRIVVRGSVPVDRSGRGRIAWLRKRIGAGVWHEAGVGIGGDRECDCHRPPQFCRSFPGWPHNMIGVTFATPYAYIPQ